MPLIDVIYPLDALSLEAQRRLSQTLWSKALRWEGIDDNETAASVAWVYLDGRPRHSISVGGHDLSQNVYRINVRVMAGFMDQERIDGMARDLTQRRRAPSLLHHRGNTERNLEHRWGNMDHGVYSEDALSRPNADRGNGSGDQKPPTNRGAAQVTALEF